jgi:hypothetical protein
VCYLSFVPALWVCARALAAVLGRLLEGGLWKRSNVGAVWMLPIFGCLVPGARVEGFLNRWSKRLGVQGWHLIVGSVWHLGTACGYWYRVGLLSGFLNTSSQAFVVWGWVAVVHVYTYRI